MDLKKRDVSFDVGIEFNVVVDVPFTQSDSEVVVAVLLDAMGCRYDVKVVDEGATTNVDGFLWIFLENGHLPWIFTC